MLNRANSEAEETHHDQRANEDKRHKLVFVGGQVPGGEYFLLLLRPIGVIDPPPNRYERGVWEPIAPPLRLDAPKKCAGVKAGQDEPKKTQGVGNQ